jgi:hypothetical protein
MTAPSIGHIVGVRRFQHTRVSRGRYAGESVESQKLVQFHINVLGQVGLVVYNESVSQVERVLVNLDER